jgi:hypothetical protein
MSRLIRLGAGNISAYDLLNTDSYLVTNFTYQSDMGNSIEWLCVQNTVLLQERRQGLEIGTGGYYGKPSCQIEFPSLTSLMRQYIDTEIMSNKPIAQVTMYLDHPINGFGVYTGELVSPFAVDAETTFDRYDSTYYNNNQYLFRRATENTTSELLLESGDFILLESGDKILLEQQ